MNRSQCPRFSLRSWLWSVPLDQEVDEELAFHAEMRTRDLIDRGVDPRVAREMVRARMGDVARLRRTCVDIGRRREREMRLTRWIDEVRDDIRFALRQLRKAPAFTVVAVATLALGIGVNSAIFAVADAALLRPLPYAQPDQLVKVNERTASGFSIGPSPLDFEDWRDQNHTFVAMSAVMQGGRAMTIHGVAEPIPTQIVSVPFFDILGVPPLLGRTFRAGDEGAALVVISEGLWRSRFAAAPDIIGRVVTIDALPATIVGVMPAGFQMMLPGGDGISISPPSGMWLPMAPTARDNPVMRSAHYYQVIGRLKPGVTIAMAEADMKPVAAAIAKTPPAMHATAGIGVEPLRAVLIGRDLRLTSMLLLGVVGFVLLLCCANVANLLLARTAGRARELAVRSAIGAGRRRIVGQLITESFVLAALGGLAGAGVGAALLAIAPSVVPAGLLPSAVTLSFDARVVAFCVAATLAVGILFGLVPAWRGTGASLFQVIASEGRTATGGSARLRGTIVAAEVAAAVLLLCGAGLLMRTLVNLASVDAGYRTSEVLTTMITLPQVASPSPPARYGRPEAMLRFYEEVERAVRRVPGVRAVAWGSALPLDGMWFGQPFQIDGDPQPPSRRFATAAYQIVSPSFFATLGIPIARGRAFTDADRETAVPVCIVDEAFVRQFLGGRQPIGMRLAVPMMSLAPSEPPVREIVGVVRQVRMRPNERDGQPTIYVPLKQNAWWAATLLVQPASGSAGALTADIRRSLASVDPDIPMARVRTMTDVSGEARSRWRFRAVIVGGFALLALALAMVGVFGVLAYSVQQRTREFGVRIALGASVADVIRLVARSAARVTAIGLAAGLAAAAVFVRWMTSLLFGVQPIDPATFAIVAVVLAATAALATIVPALRAAHVDPVVAFKAE